MSTDIWAKIGNRITALDKLYKRMDKTKDLVYLKTYKMRDFNDTYDLSNVINVTGNSPAVFANAIISDLMGAKWQTVIEGDISSKQAHQIEEFIEDNFAQADEMLLNRFGISSLYSWLCSHVCIRSLIGVRWLSLVEKGEYKVDCLPVDMRWCPYQFGKDGLAWVAPITFRTGDDLVEEYPSQGLSGTVEQEVRDYWDAEKNEVWVASKKVMEQRNSLDRPPFVVVFPPSGFMLRDKGYLEHEAPDLFFLNQGLYDEINRSLSVEQTLGMASLFPSYEYEQENFDASPAEPVPELGETKKVRKGERHQPVPQGDLNRASQIARQDMQKMIQQGGVNDIDLGNVSQTVSAVWITEQSEIRNKIIRPRLEALQIMREGLCRLMIEQFIMSSKKEGELLIGRTGKKNKYKASLLGDPDKYTISCELMTRNKKQEIANWALANAARGTAPLKVIVRDILKAEDPDGWMRELQIEEGRKADPAIGLSEMGVRYAEEAEEMEDSGEKDLKNFESMLFIERAVRIIKERMQPVVPEALSQESREPKVEGEKGNMQALIPLLGQGAGGGGGRPQQPTEVV